MATPLKVIGKGQTPQIDREFHSLIAPLQPEERRQLESNLLAEGCRDPLVTWKGTLLDGHNRLEICTRLGIPYKTCEIELPNREAALLWIESNQLGRRNLTPDQRAAIAFRILQRRVAISKRERARKGGLARSGISLVDAAATKQKGQRLRERAASEHGVSEKKIRAITDLAKIDATVVEKIVAGELTIKDAKEQVRDGAREARIRAAMKSNPRGCGIHTGDLSMLYRLIPDNAADLFLTDPPYCKSALPLFGQLAELAQAKLKPGGFCLVYTGQLYLPQVLNEMSKHLDYFWLCAVEHTGPRTRIWARRVSNGFKPILVFTKRPAATKPVHQWFGDLVHGNRDKDHHELGQGANELEYWIERLTLPNQLVVDPCCGGAAVPVACLATNRRYVSTEIDPGVAAAARARIVGYRKSRISR